MFYADYNTTQFIFVRDPEDGGFFPAVLEGDEQVVCGRLIETLSYEESIYLFEELADAVRYFVNNPKVTHILVWRTLRGAIEHCDIEVQDETVWVVQGFSNLTSTPVFSPSRFLDDDESLHRELSTLAKLDK